MDTSGEATQPISFDRSEPKVILFTSYQPGMSHGKSCRYWNMQMSNYISIKPSISDQFSVIHFVNGQKHCN